MHKAYRLYTFTMYLICQKCFMIVAIGFCCAYIKNKAEISYSVVTLWKKREHSSMGYVYVSWQHKQKHIKTCSFWLRLGLILWCSYESNRKMGSWIWNDLVLCVVSLWICVKKISLLKAYRVNGSYKSVWEYYRLL